MCVSRTTRAGPHRAYKWGFGSDESTATVDRTAVFGGLVSILESIIEQGAVVGDIEGISLPDTVARHT